MSFKQNVPLNDQLKQLRDGLLKNLIPDIDNSTLPEKIIRIQKLYINNLTFSNMKDSDIEFLQNYIKENL